MAAGFDTEYDRMYQPDWIDLGAFLERSYRAVLHCNVSSTIRHVGTSSFRAIPSKTIGREKNERWKIQAVIAAPRWSLERLAAIDSDWYFLEMEPSNLDW